MPLNSKKNKLNKRIEATRPITISNFNIISTSNRPQNGLIHLILNHFDAMTCKGIVLIFILVPGPHMILTIFTSCHTDP